jgi:hypothetical protein
MRNGDGAADNESDVECVDNFLALSAFLGAANQMIGDAVVASEDGGGNKAKNLLGFCAERAGLVSLMVQREKPFDAEVAATEYFLI